MHFEHKIIDADDLLNSDDDERTLGDKNWRVVGVLPEQHFVKDGAVRLILERER